ncbi:hypothetical protein JHK87_050508 [Glycine soja]|nr:hypothetical protein JHK87_050508 [Glycine soja]
MDGHDDFDDVDGEDDMGENEDDFIINAILDIYNIDIQNITADEVKSGVSGHYDRGQRLIIKVFDVEPAAAPPPQYANENAQNPTHKKNGKTVKELAFVDGPNPEQLRGTLKDGIDEGFEGTGDVGGVWDGGKVSR